MTKGLATEKTMTTKELAEMLGVDVRTVQMTAQRLGLAKVLSQVKIRGQNAYVFNEAQATRIKQEIQKHHNLQNRQIDNAASDLMTVEQIAQVLGYDSEYLRKKCAELGFTQNGKKTFLNEEQVTALKSVLVPRTSDMKVRGENAVTHLEMLQNIQRDMQWLIAYNSELQAENEKQKHQLIEQQPKVDTYDRIADSRGLKTLQQTAGILEIGSNTLFKTLREMGILYKDNGYNLPMRKYIERGYFKVKEEPCKKFGDEYFMYSRVFVTAKGLLWLEKKIKSN